MAIIKENGKLVNSKYINEHYKGRSVLLAYHGKKHPVGQGYIVYSSNAKTRNEALEDQQKLGDILFNELKSDGILSSGWGGTTDLCTI